MWDELERDLARYPSAVVTWVDEGGYPFSARCRAVPDRRLGGLLLNVSPELPVRAGPAGLLCHSHDERLWRLRSFAVKGAVHARDGRWVLVPHRRVEGAGYGGLLGIIRFVRAGRRTAAAYLRARGLPRPQVDWAALEELKRRASLKA